MKTVLTTILLLTAVSVHAELKLPAIFSDHMVLQRDVPVPVWGWASPGEAVTVSAGGQSVSAKAGPDGKWTAILKPLAAAENVAFSVKGATQTLTVADVAVGEVWLGSGQSNMSFQMAKDESAAIQSDAGLRFFQVKTARSLDRADDVVGKWVVCSKSVSLPGVPYFFARDVHAVTKMPFGMIVSSVGGTPISKWVDPDRMADEPALANEARKDAAARESYRKTLKNIPPGTPADESKMPDFYGRLYSGMIAPLQPYALRGMIWYQGENDGGNKAYEPFFSSLITGWRKAWGLGDIPFLFVQIAPDTANDPMIRDVQRRVWQKSKNTAMVVTIDGEVSRHPPHKEPTGARLALAARALAYGEKDLIYSGPAYSGLRVEGNKAVVSFTHLDGGLVAKDGELIGFTIAGEDQKFVPAVAKIVGDTVVVTGDGVTKPAAVRYGWDVVPKTNLFNKAGLPASPFRTDDWQIRK